MMLALKLLAVYWLLGAVLQVGVHLYSRHKHGRYAADVIVRTALGRFWPLKILSACFFWPLNVYFLCSRRARALYAAKNAAKFNDVIEHISAHCPDCGEPLEHEHAEPPQ